MQKLNRKQRRALLGKAFVLEQKELKGEKLTFAERNVLKIAKKKAVKR